MTGGLFWGGPGGGLELRAARDGSHTLSGIFTYGVPAVLSDGGRTGPPLKEVIEPQAFAYRVEDPAEDIHLLVGHDFNKPLASKASGTLRLRDTAKELAFVATVTAAIAATSHGADALALIAAGLALGLSPGFRLPPKRAVAEPETVEEEPDDPARGMHRAKIRRIKAALLYELSLVTRPAYPEAQVSLRRWEPTARHGVTLPRPAYRWRA